MSFRPATLAVMLCAVGVATVAPSLVAGQQPNSTQVERQFIGSFKLVSYISYDQDGAERLMPYSVGQITYDTAGRMSAHLMGDSRPAAAGGQGSTEQRSALYSTYIGYFGRYVVDAANGVVTHHVDGALSPGMVNTAMPRYFEFSPDGDTLYLHTKNGDRVTGRLRWERYK